MVCDAVAVLSAASTVSKRSKPPYTRDEPSSSCVFRIVQRFVGLEVWGGNPQAVVVAAAWVVAGVGAGDVDAH